jgi:pimeloyl-ACP methyl ester carboxylesterase
MIWKILLYALLGYAALCAVVFIFQRKLLYFPHQIKLSEQQAMAEGLVYWPSFADFQGFVGQVQPLEPKGTIVVFHGNAGAAYHRTFYTEALSKQNMRVILAEYPGYGGRAGRPSEHVLVEDALETIELAYQAYGEPLYLWGESLGSGVVAAAAGKTNIPVAGIVLFLAWDSLPDVAQTHYRFLPARWFVLDKYNSIENLQGYDGNVGVVLAENDEVVPVQHGENLYASITTNKKLWVIEGARHNDVPVAAELNWWNEVISFVSQ